MSLLIKNWQMADWKELLMWAKIGANNAMIGEFTEVEELSPHGRLIDADALMELYADTDDLRLKDMKVPIAVIRQNIVDMPTIIPAEPYKEKGE